jgi:hypothetical protein
MIRLRALAAVLALLVVLAGCGVPTGGAGSGPRDNRPPAGPNQPPSAPAAQGFDVYLEVEVLSAGRPILVQVVVTLNVVQTNGQMAVFTDPKTGVKGTSPIVFPRLTPVHYGITFLPGIAFAESIVTHAGPSGEQLSCWYTRDGVEIPNTRHRDIIGPTVSGTGGALVTCHYNAPT